MITLTRRRLVGAAAAAALLPPAVRTARAQERAPAAIDAVLRRAVEAGRAPGVVAVAGTDRVPVAYQGAFGVRDAAGGGALAPDSVFWIASMTKAVTSTAAMQLVERGRLDLDRPAGDVLPELRSPQVLEGFDAAGAPRLRPATRPITLRHLLTHTAGFSYDVWNADVGRYMKQAGVPGIITCQDEALRLPLVFDPGERWEYGINIDWAGKMVEAASGRRLGDYFREHIFDPLGMADTAFRISPAMRERLVRVHARQPDGSFVPIELEIPQDPEFEMGGGGLYSTAPDYLKFARVFLRDGAPILKPETVAEMARNQIGDIDVGLLKTVQPQSSADAEFFPGLEKKWGLAFMINAADAPTGRSAGSLAWAGLANTYVWIDPRRRVAGVILMQLLPFADPGALATFAEFEGEVYRMVADE
jgi:methyl acetate hydrolase